MKKLYFVLFLLFGSFANAQIIEISDANFKQKLLASSTSNEIALATGSIRIKIDANDNGEIEVPEVAAVVSLNVSNSNIASVAGIEHFVNMTTFNCSHNQISSLDFTELDHLKNLDCGFNQLTALNFDGITDTLRNIDCQSNQITSLDLTAMETTLSSLSCSDNQLTSLTLHSALVYDPLNVDEEYPFRLNCNNNPLQTLDISGNFDGMSLLGLPLETIDLSQCTTINVLQLGSTYLKYLNIKNGQSGLNTFASSWMWQSPNLQYICADPGLETEMLLQAQETGNYNVEINDYCSFTPGGVVYQIAGDNHLDINANGCDASDIGYPYFKFNITNGSQSGTIYTGHDGNYQVSVGEGSHTMTPILENPSYFNVTPPSIAVAFPATTTPSTNDFCITPNGTHADLEVTLVPLFWARPGFDVPYSLVYRNKGNVTISGTISFSHEDKAAFVSAVPSVTSQGAQVLNWAFTDLQPFEQREIIIVMNVNSPTETPAVNDGDVLHFYTSGTTDLTDDTPDDNYAFLNQTVVNSFDPNDKTCLEGNTIDPSMIGKYVHYQIRFENTGTANAENIVVADEIDADKFDISSLVPMDASHDFTTRINGNKVEFIFENIQLPFDDANNDGYVLFKIKTKPTLTVGDSFSNSASIYFDYNHPIVTDPAVTTIQLLGQKDFEFTQEFALYPNPANDVLNIQSKGNAKIQSMAIYNTLGQLVLAVTNAQNISKIDVSQLKTGNYFLKVTSDKGSSNSQFTKQ